MLPPQKIEVIQFNRHNYSGKTHHHLQKNEYNRKSHGIKKYMTETAREI